MSNIEKIKAEIERLKAKYRKDMYKSNYEGLASGYKIEAYNELLFFIDSLPEETCKDSLQVPETCKENTDSFTSLEEAAEERARKIYPYEGGTKGLICETSIPIFKAGFIAGAKWMEDQIPMPEDTVIFMKGVAEGRRLEREDGGLAWQDIKSIVQIADKMLDDPKARVAFQNHNEEYYYKSVLDEYNRLHQATEE